MTEPLKIMITDYKNKGERVDEVLFHEVNKVIDRAQKADALLEKLYHEMGEGPDEDVGLWMNKEVVRAWSKTDDVWSFSVIDVKILLEQAERTETLENSILKFIEMQEYYLLSNGYLRDENKRLREAVKISMDYVQDGRNPRANKLYKDFQRVLEGEK